MKIKILKRKNQEKEHQEDLNKNNSTPSGNSRGDNHNNSTEDDAKYYNASIKIPTVGTNINFSSRMRGFRKVVRKIDDNFNFLKFGKTSEETAMSQI